MATHFGKASVAISPVLIEHVENLHSMALAKIAPAEAPSNQAPALYREGPHRSPLAIPAHILAVAAVEAFVNEMFLSDLALMTIGSWPGEAGGSSLPGKTKSEYLNSTLDGHWTGASSPTRTCCC